LNIHLNVYYYNVFLIDEDQALDLQAELCDLQCDLSLKTQLKKGVNFF